MVVFVEVLLASCIRKNESEKVMVPFISPAQNLYACRMGGGDGKLSNLVSPEKAIKVNKTISQEGRKKGRKKERKFFS